MANPEHLAILKEGVEQWNKWREEHRTPDLSGAYLVDADLRGADLSWGTLTHANLQRVALGGANLSEADLNRANLREADLREADLRWADLHWANLSRADLSRADLSGANLSWATLTHANLRRADVSEAQLGYTIFANTDLSETKGLELCDHDGPSSIGIDTFFRSKGKIPESFLRGCGVPEVFITYARSLVGQPIEFYSCFISYSSHDQAFAERLHADMVAKQLRFGSRRKISRSATVFMSALKNPFGCSIR